MEKLFLKLLTSAYAQEPPNIKDIVLPGSNFTSLEGLIVGVINWMLILAGILAVVALIYSGIMYITAGGNADQAAKAQKNITWAVIGIVIILLSLAIVNWVINIVNTGRA